MAKLVAALTRVVGRGGKRLLRFLREHGLLADKLKCPKCKHRMKFCKFASSADGYKWRCRNARHREISRSIRLGSLFENSHMSLQTWMKIILSFAQGLRRRHVDILEEETCRSSASISKVYDRLRRCCIAAMERLEQRKKMKIGGRRAYVVIDESLFRHKRKYNRGRFGTTWRNRRTWVFGMLEVDRHRRRPVLKLVERRSRAHLLPIISKYVVPGAKILSDSWRAYNALPQHGYVHYQVNHQRFFVHPTTGAHTQHIERAWRTYKEDVYRFRGNLSEVSLKNSLRIIEWNNWLGKDYRHGTLGRLFHDIRQMYKV